MGNTAKDYLWHSRKLLLCIHSLRAIPNVIEKLAFDKEAAQICASERVTIVRAQAPRSEAQICCEADVVKNQFFNCVRYIAQKNLYCYFFLLS